MAIFQNIRRNLALSLLGTFFSTIAFTEDRADRTKIIVWSAPWCQSCLELKDFLQEDSEIQNLLKNYATQEIDATTPKGQQWAHKHRVTQSYPQLLFIDRSGSELTRLPGTPARSELVAILEAMYKVTLDRETALRALGTNDFSKLKSPEDWQYAALLANGADKRVEKMRFLTGLYLKSPPPLRQVRWHIIGQIFNLSEEVPARLFSKLRMDVDSAIRNTREELPLFMLYQGEEFYHSVWGTKGKEAHMAVGDFLQHQSTDDGLPLTYRLRILHALSLTKRCPLEVENTLERAKADFSRLSIGQKAILIRALFASGQREVATKLASTATTEEVEPGLFAEIIADNAEDSETRRLWRRQSFESTRDLPTALLRGFHLVQDLPPGEEQIDVVFQYLNLLQAASCETLANFEVLIGRFFSWVDSLSVEERQTIAQQYGVLCREERCEAIRKMIIDPSVDIVSNITKSSPVLLTIQDSWVRRENRVFLQVHFSQAIGYKVYSPRDRQAPLQGKLIKQNNPSFEAWTIGSTSASHHEVRQGLDIDYFDKPFKAYIEPDRPPAPKESFSLEVTATLCEAECIPVRIVRSVAYDPALETAIDNEQLEALAPVPISAEVGPPDTWFRILVLAFLGGIILNFMPCVLPVLGMKLASLLPVRSESVGRFRMHLAAYSAGIFATLLSVGLAVLLLSALGHSVGWGFHMQSPAFVWVLTLLMLVFALNLFGVFEFRTPFTQRLAGAKTGVGYLGDFFNGAITALLATPCSAPFIGTAVGAALSGPPIMVLPVFAAVAIGLCLPFFIIAVTPGASHLLPKGGPWMAKLKKILGFGMLLSACWLLQVFLVLSPAAAFVAYASIAVGVVSLTVLEGGRMRYLLVALAVSLPLISLAYINPPFNTSMRPWQQDTIVEMQRVHQGAFIEVTAEWCLTCKVNHQLVINTQSFRDWLDTTGLTYVRADFTNRDTSIGEFLKAQKVAGVPAYFVLNKSGSLTYLGSSISLNELEAMDTH